VRRAKIYLPASRPLRRLLIVDVNVPSARTKRDDVRDWHRAVGEARGCCYRLGCGKR